MTSHIPLQLPLASPSWGRLSAASRRHFRLSQDIRFDTGLFKGLTRLGGKHGVMRIFQSLQHGLSCGKVFRGIRSRPFLRVKQDFSGFNRIIHSLADASRWAKGHCHGLIKTHDAYSNAGQRGWEGAVA